jgi:transcriptional regulator with XRE-family HTH domain
MQSNEMKAVMARNNDTQAKLAEELGLPVSGLNARINGQIDFRASEIKKIAQRYNLSPEKLGEIFFEDFAS